MLKHFSYNKAGLEPSAVDIVEGILALSRQTYANKKDPDYSDKNTFLCGAMARYAVTGTKFENRLAAIEEEDKKNEAARKLFEDALVRNNQNVRSNFAIILTQVINAIVPEVANDTYFRYLAETRQIGFGDTATFRIESNDLFAVKDQAEGIRRTVDQPMWNDEITVPTHRVSLSSHIDWYPFAAGTFDMGNFGVKIARSISAYIFIKAVKGMTAATTEFGAAYQAAGVSVQQWGTLKQRVQAANGGMKVIAIGTAIALSNANISGNYQVEIGEEMTKVGYLDQYLGTPLIAIDNVLAPGATNTTGALTIPDNIIYMVPVAGDKPVKIVFEGNQTSVSDDPENTADERYGITVSLRLGVSAVCGAKFGTITL